MAYHEESYVSSHSTYSQPQRRKYTSRRTPGFDSRRDDLSTYAEPERQIRCSSPRRRRWATGYIDRRDCPSYAYIDTRSRSPDGHHCLDAAYMVTQDYRTDDYIQPHQRDLKYAHSVDSLKPRPRQNRKQVLSAQRDSVHDSRFRQGISRPDLDLESLDDRPHRRRYRSPYQASITGGKIDAFAHRRRRDSDLESLDDRHHQRSPSHERRSRPARTSNIHPSSFGKRNSDASPRRPSGSDVGSLPSRRNSVARSDTQSVASLRALSDVEARSGRGGSGSGSGSGSVTKRRSGSGTESESDSDSEGGYISLDDYITKSDYASEMEGLGDEGEGSDAVVSDSVSESDDDEGSDALRGSDVESLEDGGGCISGEDWIGEEDRGYNRRYRR